MEQEYTARTIKLQRMKSFLLRNKNVWHLLISVFYLDNANCSKYLTSTVNEKNMRQSNGGMKLMRKSDVLKETCLCATVYITSPTYSGLCLNPCFHSERQ